MSTIETKWKANQEKVEFLKQFPGLLNSWEETAGHTIQQVIPLPSQSGSAVLVFTDGSFAVVPPLAPQPRDLTEGITAARHNLEPTHSHGYSELDRLTRIDQEAAHQARLENILGAINNNIDQIPELKDRLRSLVQKWNS